MIEKWLAKLGWIGVLVILLTASVALNAWQFKRAGSADGRCDNRIGGMVAEVDKVVAEREVKALDVSRDTKERAEEAVNEIESETVRQVERIRVVEIPVPAECDGPMPDSVRDTLSDAARATNRRL